MNTDEPKERRQSAFSASNRARIEARPTVGWAVPFRERSYWLAAAAIAYTCVGAMPSASRPIVPLLALFVLPVWLAEVWRRTANAKHGERHLDSVALSALRACHFGAALWVAARLGAPGRAAYDAVANLGTAIAAVAAQVALARMPSEGGLLAPPPATRSLDAAAFAGFLWGIAIALPGTRALFPASNVLLDPLAIDYATTTASVGSLLVFIAAAFRLRIERRLEIGAADRVRGAFALALTAFFAAVPAAAFDIASPDRLLPCAVLAGALACTWTATTREPTTVSKALRGVLAIMILGVPAALFVAVAARAFPDHAAPITLIGSVIAIGVGLVARDVARPLGPEQSRWLDAILQASDGALQPDPDTAIRSALDALRGATGDPNARPLLFRNDPGEVLSVDVAGYLHVDKADAPERLYDLALGEPERTLRTDVLRALEVRRPDVRPLLAWMEAREAFSLTVILDDEGPIGFLLLARGSRELPMTLEEARALRLLTDRLSALFSVSSALARSRQRELAATRHATTVDAERTRLERIIDSASSRHHASAELLARPVRTAAYSPAARFAIHEVERAGATGEPLALVTRSGIDAAAWAAIAHAASPGHGGPLVVVDGAISAEHDEARWQDPANSPLALADGGTLVVLDVAALPLVVQEWIARPPRRASDDPASVVPPMLLVVSLRGTASELLAQGRLSRNLAARLRHDVELPSLSSRTEDLRSMVLERLAAYGMRTRGQPLGIAPPALALLVEHDWPGNDAELRDVLGRAADSADGPLVTAADLAAIGFHAIVPMPPPLPAPVPEARRRRSRPVSRRS
jgi:hypothetical protein